MLTYDDPCPSCGDAMRYPTSCACPYELRVLALAGHNAADLPHLVGRRKINAAMRELDQSDLYPINGRFNATDRAIRRIREYERANGSLGNGFEYAAVVDGEISRIVNDPRAF